MAWQVLSVLIVSLVLTCCVECLHLHSHKGRQALNGHKLKPLTIQQGSVYKKQRPMTSVGIISLVRHPSNIETWLQIHQQLGVRHFYICVEDSDDVFEYLDKLPHVTVKKSTEKDDGKDEYWTLMKRQGKWQEEAFWLARNDAHGVKWLVFMDADEILWGNLSVIEALPEKVRTFRLNNYEAVYDKVPTLIDNCFEATFFLKCYGNENRLSSGRSRCVTYANGKAGGRIAKDVYPFGPHYMGSHVAGVGGPTLDGIVIRHYDSCTFSKWKDKMFHLIALKDHKNLTGSYYRESVEALKSNNILKMYKVYKQYRVLTKKELEEIKRKGLQETSSMSIIV